MCVCAAVAQAPSLHRRWEWKVILFSFTAQNGMYDELSTAQLWILVDCIRDANEFARKFNLDLPLRTALWKAGMVMMCARELHTHARRPRKEFMYASSCASTRDFRAHAPSPTHTRVLRVRALMRTHTRGWGWLHPLTISPSLSRVVFLAPGFMRQLPNLLRQETSSVHAGAAIMFAMDDDPAREDAWPEIEDRLGALWCAPNKAIVMMSIAVCA